MSWRPEALPPDVLGFLRDRHLATLTTLRDDGSPHVVPVGFTFDPATAVARVITSASSIKAANAGADLDASAGVEPADDERRTRRAALCQVDGRRWLTLEGPVRVASDGDVVAAAVAAYAVRYRQPGERADRVVIEIAVDRVMGRC